MSATQKTDIVSREQNVQGVLRLTLNEDGRRNALSEAMMKRLGDELNSAASDQTVRVIGLAAR
jgi:enoyl-CoA hydratase/carnithine racemase